MRNKLWKKLACRRGLGIEIALLVMLVTTAMCILLVSTALLEKENIDTGSAEVTERLALDQIGQDFLSGKITGKTPEGENYKGYVIYACVPGQVLKVHSLYGELKLDVAINGDKITQWSYHNLGIGGQ